MMMMVGFLLLTLAISAPPAYQPHPPIIIQNQPTSSDNPLVIEGYEISNPAGPGIQVRDVDHVIIRNNYLHDCGTKVSEQRQRLVKETGDARKGMLDKPFETGAILVFDAQGTVQISGNEVRGNDDYDVQTHPDDWKYDGKPVVFKLASDEQMAMFEIDAATPDERADEGMVVLLILFVASGLLLTALSLPMIFHEVPPNYWYGFRVRATLENEEVWYPANAYAGKRLFWVGIGTLVGALVVFPLPIPNVGVYASIVGGIVMVGLVVTLVQSFLYLRTLTDRH